MTAEPAEPAEAEPESDATVSPLELFFDLVFVFAITQVTQLIAHDADWEHVAQGMILLTLIWWAWVAYAWLTNELDTDEDRVRIVMLIAMAAMFLVALAIPKAFGDDGVLFGCAYLVVRAAHVLLFSYATTHVSVQQAAKGLAPTGGLACALVIAAAFLDGGTQYAVFAAAIAIDLVGGGRGVGGFRLNPGHFVERHGLILIIAFGESIVATGIGAGGTDLGMGEIAAATLVIVIASSLWWAYFDVLSLVAEPRLEEAPAGLERNSLARDAYSYIHLALIAGIVLLALGAKKTLEHVDEPLKTVPAAALCGGVALYLLGHLAFRLRMWGSIDRLRLAVALVAAALIPIATNADALVALGLLATLTCALIVYETFRDREKRRGLHQRPA